MRTRRGAVYGRSDGFFEGNEDLWEETAKRGLVAPTPDMIAKYAEIRLSGTRFFKDDKELSRDDLVCDRCQGRDSKTWYIGTDAMLCDTCVPTIEGLRDALRTTKSVP